MSPLPPTDDPRDKVQAQASGALGQLIGAAIDDLQVWIAPTGVDVTRRVTFHYLAQAVWLVADGHSLLRAGETTFAHARSASNQLRTLCDLHARQLSTWQSSNPKDRLESLLADSVRQDLLALEAAEAAGSDVLDLRRGFQTIQSSLPPPSPINVVNELKISREHELLCVYRWESTYLHSGIAALASAARTVTSPSATLDVAMWPMTLWRIGQLTWALYGVGLRVWTHLAARLSLELSRVRGSDASLRGVVRTAAKRPRPEHEPAAPTYSDFDFPLWS
jgi:hypothetical protein